MEDVWSVKDGVLRCEAKPVGYLRTESKYTSYVLKLEWRWPEGSKPGNSGVLLRTAPIFSQRKWDCPLPNWQAICYESERAGSTPPLDAKRAQRFAQSLFDE